VDLVARTGTDARRICARLRPEVLDDLGLIPAIKYEIDLSTRIGGPEKSGITAGG
jgi:signal transduction histidine kinase